MDFAKYLTQLEDYLAWSRIDDQGNAPVVSETSGERVKLGGVRTNQADRLYNQNPQAEQKQMWELPQTFIPGTGGRIQHGWTQDQMPSETNQIDVTKRSM